MTQQFLPASAREFVWRHLHQLNRWSRAGFDFLVIPGFITKSLDFCGLCNQKANSSICEKWVEFQLLDSFKIPYLKCPKSDLAFETPPPNSSWKWKNVLPVECWLRMHHMPVDVAVMWPTPINGRCLVWLIESLSFLHLVGCVLLLKVNDPKLKRGRSPSPEYDSKMADVQGVIDNNIKGSTVMIFSKSYCPFCKKVCSAVNVYFMVMCYHGRDK